MQHKIFTAALLLTSSLLPSQTGTFVTYGTACPGSGGYGCIEANMNQPFSGNIGVVGANFALPANTGAMARVVCAVELMCKLTVTGSRSINVWLYDTAANGTPGSILASTTMTVTGQLATNRATFATPPILNPNFDFFIVFENVGLNLPIMASGTNNVHYFGGPPTWRGPFTSVPWSYRIVCCGASTPTISGVGVPNINQSFAIDLNGAVGNATALLAIGFGQTFLDLTIIGAPGCTLYTAPLEVLGTTTTGSGSARLKFGIPNTQNLVNTVFNCQWGVADPANAAGIVFSDAGEGKIGQ